MGKKLSACVLLYILILLYSDYRAQAEDTIFTSKSISNIKLRSIGPAFMSGRIADIAIHPDNKNIWYVAVGSGGVWKTINSGTTWQPIFDNQSSYSVGCITIDPNNPNVIWVGTGENVGGRHVGYGDGIYRSEDGGNSWKNLGLKNSEHISKIIVNPDNSDIIYAAVQGPLWNKGGERGFYKSDDYGKSWKRTLGDNLWVGVTDIILDPRESSFIYAATWQRHRNVAAYMGGGPGSGIYKSVDGGETWTELKKGLPKSNMGKIGLAISPQKPDVIYAAIELDRRKGGVYRSDNRGASWIKMSDAVSGATGPHYYQELYTTPHKFDKLYLVDVRMQVSEDGGKTFERMKEQYKHSDNHAIAFDPDDPEYLLVGTDGGLYESFDNTETWKFVNNLPVTQFYKVAVDDKAPFYTVYGGTQDNNTQGGPSRTDNVHGIRNSDWFLTLGGDGHQPATEPGNPNIVYSQSQQGYLSRIDVSTGEIVFIQPQPDEGEPFERFNWDSPILVSPHNPKRIYFASQRVWRSDNRGDSWEVISGDMTKNQERIALPIMDKLWSWDSPWDIYAMSTYNTITSINESPKMEGLIYAGTDDGLIQITEDGGNNWKKINVGDLPGVPSTAFVNDIKADLHNVNTAYIVLDNHKFGDFKPYILKTNDRGATWRSIRSNLPDRTLVWRVVQDHIDPEILFVGTEFGIYVTINGGSEWVQMKGGVPTVSFRDLAIQRRENDLIGASFGRGFYILDDYSFLRKIKTGESKKKEAELFIGRDALLYIPRPGHGFSEKGSQGASYFTAENPPFGAVFTYYLSEKYKTIKSIRKEKEKELIEQEKDVPFPGWNKIEEERRQDEPRLWIIIKDMEENVVRKVEALNKKGFNRISWDLRYPDLRVIDSNKKPPERERSGLMVLPGTYTAVLSKEIDGVLTDLTDSKPFNVKKLYDGELTGADQKVKQKYIKDITNLNKEISAASLRLSKAVKKIEAMEYAVKKIRKTDKEIIANIHNAKQQLFELDEYLNGNRSKREVREKYAPTLLTRLSVAERGVRNSTYGPTPMHFKSFEIAKRQIEVFRNKLAKITGSVLPDIEKRLEELGSPIIE